jgi:hypothetical protein
MATLGEVRFESRLLPAPGLDPILLLLLLLLVAAELILEVDGVGLVPRFSDRGEDLTLRHRFLAPSFTKSPKSGTSLLTVSPCSVQFLGDEM